MLSLVTTNSHWFWLTLAGALLLLELVGAYGYLLWCGISALSIGLLVLLFPLTWEWQWIGFSLLALTTALFWWYWLQHRKKRGQQVFVNQRELQLLGLVTTLTEPLKNGFGRIKIADGSWRVYSEEEITVGSKVEVVGIDGITLKIRKIATTENSAL